MDLGSWTIDDGSVSMQICKYCPRRPDGRCSGACKFSKWCEGCVLKGVFVASVIFESHISKLQALRDVLNQKRWDHVKRQNLHGPSRTGDAAFFTGGAVRLMVISLGVLLIAEGLVLLQIAR